MYILLEELKHSLFFITLLRQHAWDRICVVTSQVKEILQNAHKIRNG